MWSLRYILVYCWKIGVFVRRCIYHSFNLWKEKDKTLMYGTSCIPAVNSIQRCICPLCQQEGSSQDVLNLKMLKSVYCRCLHEAKSASNMSHTAMGHRFLAYKWFYLDTEFICGGHMLDILMSWLIV